MHRLQLLLAGLVLSTGLGAQTLSLGVKLGPTWSWQTESCCGEYEPRTGVSGGLTGSLALSRVFGVQAEVLFAEKGVRGPAGFWMRQGYLEMPILVRATWPTGRLVSPVLLVGVAPAAELSCSGQTTTFILFSGGSPPLVPLDCDSMRSFRGDLGLVASIGADLAVGRAVWTSELRFTHGTSNLNQAWTSIPEANNRAVVLMVGVRSARR